MATFRTLDEQVPRGKVFGNELNLLRTFVPEMHYCLYMVKINVLCHIFLRIQGKRAVKKLAQGEVPPLVLNQHNRAEPRKKPPQDARN